MVGGKKQRIMVSRIVNLQSVRVKGEKTKRFFSENVTPLEYSIKVRYEIKCQSLLLEVVKSLLLFSIFNLNMAYLLFFER